MTVQSYDKVIPVKHHSFVAIHQATVLLATMVIIK